MAQGLFRYVDLHDQERWHLLIFESLDSTRLRRRLGFNGRVQGNVGLKMPRVSKAGNLLR